MATNFFDKDDDFRYRLNRVNTFTPPFNNFSQPKTFYEPPKPISYEPPKPVYLEDPVRTPLQHAQQVPYMHIHPSLRPPGMM